MFLPGIGGHLKVSHMDPRVSFGNESTNLSVPKSFFKIIAPYFPSSLTSFPTSVHFVGVRVSSFSPSGSSSLLVTLPITLHLVGVRGCCSFWICLERCSSCCEGTEAWIRPVACIVLLILLLCCGLDLRPLCACLVLSILLV